MAVGQIVAVVRSLFGLSPNPGQPTLITDGGLGILFDELTQDSRLRRSAVNVLGVWNGGASALISFMAAQYYVGGAGIVATQGAGSPEGVVAAPVGSLYLRSDGGSATTLYVKESGLGTVGWVAVGTATDVPVVAVNYTNGNAGTITVGQVVYVSAAAPNTVNLATAAADAIAARAVGFVFPAGGILALGLGKIATDGRVTAKFEPALALTEGDEIFLSATVPGSVTNVAPAVAGQVIQTVGYLASVATYNGAGILLATLQIRFGSKAVV